LGDSGATVTEPHTKNPKYKKYSETTLWNAALHMSPDIVAIMLGSCDAKIENWDQGSADHFSIDYRNYVSSLNSMEKRPKVYIISPPPILPCIERPRNHG